LYSEYTVYYDQSYVLNVEQIDLFKTKNKASEAINAFQKATIKDVKAF